MDLEKLSKIGKDVWFVFSELKEAYDSGNREEIEKWEDISSNHLFWYYLGIGDAIREYSEMENDENLSLLIERLREQFSNMGDYLRKLALRRESRLSLGK